MRGFPSPAVHLQWLCSMEHFDTTFLKYFVLLFRVILEKQLMHKYQTRYFGLFNG